jgi:hypothetical protein
VHIMLYDHGVNKRHDCSIKTGSPVFFQNGACWPGSCIKLEHTNFRQISGVNQPSKVLTSARSNRLNAATWLAPHRTFS